MKPAAIYARVSSQQQKEEDTIASQTAAVQEYAQKQGYGIPKEWIFEDEGCSGYTLVRPALERLRDLTAEGHIQTILIYSPDRLSRKYAYQVLLMEEFKRNGAEVIFILSPKAETPQEQLLVQFQGMIAEYERAQITERTRRGKRYAAKNGLINALGGAPYGYRYIKKSDAANAGYEVVEAESIVVREIFHLYADEGSTGSAIARRLAQRAVSRRKGGTARARTRIDQVMLMETDQTGMQDFRQDASQPRIRRPQGWLVSARAWANRAWDCEA